jgi:transcriptional regulator with XRE-family HTH domain
VWVRPRDYKVVGNRLAAARRGTGITQKELARRLRKPQSFVSDYERGQRRVDLIEFLLIVSALKLDPHKVFAEIAVGHGRQH